MQGEVCAATFQTAAEAEGVARTLRQQGLADESIVVLTDKQAKHDFMKRYVHRDADRHKHAGVGAVGFGCGGALVMGLVSILLFSPETTTMTIVFAVAGAAFGAVIGGLLGSLALRQADDQSVELMEKVESHGVLVAVECPPQMSEAAMEEVTKEMTRAGGVAMRIHHSPSLSDLHPGDTRKK